MFVFVFLLVFVLEFKLSAAASTPSFVEGDEEDEDDDTVELEDKVSAHRQASRASCMGEDCDSLTLIFSNSSSLICSLAVWNCMY